MHAQAPPSNVSRRHFLEVSAVLGGGLVLGLLLPGAGIGTDVSAGKGHPRDDESGGGFVPNAYIRIDRDGKVTFTMGKAEMGQDIFTAMSMLLAEELDVDLATISLVQAPADDKHYADPLIGAQVTGGSTSIRGAWKPMREAGATARALLVTAAAQRWKVPPSSCSTAAGKVHHADSYRSLDYGQLVDEAARLPLPTAVPLKDPKDFRLIGKPMRRLDAADKVTGRTQYGIDVRLPGMRVATVSACPVPGGTLSKVDEAAALAVPGVRQVVQIDNAVAVVADHMWAASQGLEAAKPQWSEGPNRDFSSAALREELIAAMATRQGAIAQDKGSVADAFKTDGTRVEAVYELPFLAHATMEPMNCTVELTDERCEIWTGTQAQTRAQEAAAQITGLDKSQVLVHNQFLGGGFGRRLEVDYVIQAVQFAKLIKGPVKFVWSREEDVRLDIMRTYYYNRLSARLAADGSLMAWQHRIIGTAVMARWLPSWFRHGVDPDAVLGAVDLVYSIPNLQVEYIRHDCPLPAGKWRGVGPTHNVFVVESFMDELATKAGRDPFEYRRALVQHSPRAKAVLELAASKAGWGGPLAPAQDGHSKAGRGIAVQFAFASYAAQVAEVEVDERGKVRVRRVVCVVDCGTVVNPSAVQAQFQSAVIFALSAALYGEITYANGRVQQSNFHDYRVLRINETPAIEVYIVPSTEGPGGMGEVGTPALAPAVTNAIFAATGRRIRKLPVRTLAAAR
jgi:isoquinoline 1-oxidoreductase beta subunit